MPDGGEQAQSVHSVSGLRPSRLERCGAPARLPRLSQQCWSAANVVVCCICVFCRNFWMWTMFCVVCAFSSVYIWCVQLCALAIPALYFSCFCNGLIWVQDGETLWLIKNWEYPVLDPIWHNLSYSSLTSKFLITIKSAFLATGGNTMSWKQNVGIFQIPDPGNNCCNFTFLEVNILTRITN